MNDLVFYTNPNSRGRMIRWVLEELKLDYKTVGLEFGAGMKDQSFLKVNPLGKVPAIVHKGKVVTECAAICCYLAETFTHVNLLPRPFERADFYRWIFYATTTFEQVLCDRIRKVENQNGWEGFVSHGGDHDQVFQLLRDALGKHAYIAGERFTVADIILGYQINLGLLFKIIPADPVFKNYVARLRSREGFEAARKLDSALMKEMKTKSDSK